MNLSFKRFPTFSAPLLLGGLCFPSASCSDRAESGIGVDSGVTEEGQEGGVTRTDAGTACNNSVKCTGVGDDKAINTAIEVVAASGGGTVCVQAGACLIDAVNTHVVMQSNVRLSLDPAAVLHAMATSSGTYQIVVATDVTNAGIIGGKIIGDLVSHTGGAGEWGHGISLSSVTDFTISDITITECWGDGIYISAGGGQPSKNVSVDHVSSDRNRRQGLSGISWIGGSITNSTFSNTGAINGTPPKGGIDFEPNGATDQVTGISITNNKFIGNTGVGVVFSAHSGIVGNNAMSYNTFTSNGGLGGIAISYSSNNVISNNIISLSGLDGISVDLDSSSPPAWGASAHNVISGNSVASSNQRNLTGMNIDISGSASNNKFTDNILTSQTAMPEVYCGIWIGSASNVDNVFSNTTNTGPWLKCAVHDSGSGTVMN